MLSKFNVLLIFVIVSQVVASTIAVKKSSRTSRGITAELCLGEVEGPGLSGFCRIVYLDDKGCREICRF